MNNDIEKTFISTNLKYLRNKNGKSLNDVAKVCDKTDVAVHYWENGTREPNAVDIAKLSNYYDITVDELLLKDLRLNYDINLNSKSVEEQEDNLEQLKQFRLLYDKMKDLPEESQRMIYNVTKSVIDEIDAQLDNKK